MKLNERISFLLIALLAITVVAGRAMSVPRGAKSHMAQGERPFENATDHAAPAPPASIIPLTDVIIETLSPIQDKFNQYMNDKSYLETVWRSGAEHASRIAERTLSKVMKKVGFVAR